MLVVQYSRDKVAKWDSCVVWDQWRLVKGEELYDVDADRAQKNDLAAKHPDVVTEDARPLREVVGRGRAEGERVRPVRAPRLAKQPEVALTSADWEDIYADNTGHVRNAVGGPRGGHWHVFVETPGEYEIVLRRWPRETKAALGAKNEADAKLADVGGKNYNPPSKAFPIAAALVQIAGQEATARPPRPSRRCRAGHAAGREDDAEGVVPGRGRQGPVRGVLRLREEGGDRKVK